MGIVGTVEMVKDGIYGKMSVVIVVNIQTVTVGIEVIVIVWVTGIMPVKIEKRIIIVEPDKWMKDIIPKKEVEMTLWVKE